MTICWPDKTKPQASDELVSLALDIPVTLLDLIGVDKPASMSGLSLLPLVKGKTKRVDRDYVVAETTFAEGNHDGLRGRMLRTKQFKYCVYDAGKNREQLFDMASDPVETRNLAVVKSHERELNRHRQLLAQWATETQDVGFPFVPAQTE